MIAQFALQVAAIMIVSAGFCVMFNLRQIAWKLFSAAVVLAAAAGLIPGQFG